MVLRVFFVACCLLLFVFDVVVAVVFFWGLLCVLVSGLAVLCFWLAFVVAVLATDRK